MQRSASSAFRPLAPTSPLYAPMSISINYVGRPTRTEPADPLLSFVSAPASSRDSRCSPRGAPTFPSVPPVPKLSLSIPLHSSLSSRQSRPPIARCSNKARLGDFDRQEAAGEQARRTGAGGSTRVRIRCSEIDSEEMAAVGHLFGAGEPKSSSTDGANSAELLNQLHSFSTDNASQGGFALYERCSPHCASGGRLSDLPVRRPKGPRPLASLSLLLLIHCLTTARPTWLDIDLNRRTPHCRSTSRRPLSWSRSARLLRGPSP